MEAESPGQNISNEDMGSLKPAVCRAAGPPEKPKHLSPASGPRSMEPWSPL